MNRPTAAGTVIGVLGAALVGIAIAASPAQARLDPGTLDPGTPDPVPTTCYLERIGTQLVRCDVLTGNGVPAPYYIPEQH